jgi:NAD(P)-dependent dehydrogenase (short-subunit alcohol dehydrogenase family)
MGLAVSEELKRRNDWQIHILDLNAQRGEEAANNLGKNAVFHQTDVNSYASLSSVFDKIFKSTGRLDFVFANAGIVENWNFYAKHAASPPPEPDQLSIDIDFKSVVNQSYLALHYFRLSSSAGTGEQSLIMTASCGGLYPSSFCPMYSGAKHAVIGFMRSIAKAYYYNDKIRVNAICPGTVRTNLLDSDGWSTFPPEYFTPVSKIVETVVMLVDGGELTDSKGVVVKKEENWGRAVEINTTKHYFREQPEWCDDIMKTMMSHTEIKENDARFK